MAEGAEEASWQKDMQKERIENIKLRGDRHLSEEGRAVEITVDLVLQARAKLSHNKVSAADAIVSEMMKALPWEKLCVVAECFQQRFKGVVQALDSWMTVKLVFLRKPDAEPKKGIQGYRAIALTSVMSKWYASCVVMLLERENEPEAWEKLVVGGINNTSCQHLEVMTTNLLHKHWEWQENRSHEKSWMCGTADDVSCQLGHQHCL